MSGHVEIETDEGARVLGDRICYDLERRVLDASGTVVLSFPGAVLSGSRLVYRVDEGTGGVDDAVGYLEVDGAILRADRIARVGPRRLEVENAVFTTCTQPVPYWSFRIASGTFDIGEYAYLKGVAFKAGHIPVFYSPYLAWPIKTDRAAGLLFPKFNSSDKLGQSIGVPFYWPVASNADITFLFEWYSKVGLGLGAELEWLPSWRGAARGDVRWINDQVRKQNRYSMEWEQRQDLPADFRLTSRLEFISDFNYLTDYETDLARAASPSTRSTVDITKNWSWYSLSMRAVRSKQFFVGGAGLTRFLTGEVVNMQLPEVELRGRSRRIGSSPAFFSFESSLAGFRKQILEPPAGQFGADTEDDLITRVNNGWVRADFAPELQLPLFRLPWLDMQLSGGWRGTWYSARPDPNDPQQITSESVLRNLWKGGLSIAGPRFQRVFQTPNWAYSPRLKHVIEPFVNYQWQPQASTRDEEIVVFDEIDNVPARLSDVTYGVRQRLFALRAPATKRSSSLASAREVSFQGIEEQQQRARQREQIEAEQPELTERMQVDERLNPTEILSLEIFQRHSFVRPLSTVYAVLTDPATGDDLIDPVTGRPITREIGSRFTSPITGRLRFNPTADDTVDLTYIYDPANEKLTESSISVQMLTGDRGYLRGSWFRRQPSNPAFAETSSFLRARWGLIQSRRFFFETEIDFDLEEGQLDHQAYTVSYATQCCSFRLGYDRRDFIDNLRREYTLVVNLRGLGEVLNLRQSQDN